jgi:pantetheine-phosphate adenylyltransferase
MATALYPGSFDPFRLGHLSAVEQVPARYERLVVAVLANRDKAGFLEVAQRVELVAASTRHRSHRAGAPLVPAPVATFLEAART